MLYARPLQLALKPEKADQFLVSFAHFLLGLPIVPYLLPSISTSRTFFIPSYFFGHDFPKLSGLLTFLSLLRQQCTPFVSSTYFPLFFTVRVISRCFYFYFF